MPFAEYEILDTIILILHLDFIMNINFYHYGEQKLGQTVIIYCS